MDFETVGAALGVFVGGVVVIVLIAVIISFPTMWLWNWLMPTIFSLPEITVWQALGLNLLSGFLLKSSTTVNTKK